MKTNRTIMMALVAVVAAVLLSGCTLEEVGIRLGVLGENVQSEVDTLLGEAAVMRAEAVKAVADAGRYMAAMETAYVENKVDADLVGEKLSVLWANRAQVQALLGRLAELIAAGQPVTTRDGRTVGIGEMETFARAKMATFDLLELQIAAWEETQVLYQEAATEALAELESRRLNVASMNDSLALLDAKLALLKVLKQRTEQSARTTDPQLAQEQGNVQTILDEVERAIRIARERKSLPTPGELSAEETAALESLVGESGSLVDELRERAGQ